ncbi:hypothetical protein PO254_20240, partial [Bacteroides ovatus]|uniref:hypothetical protein n=1 Tax=Bacteroides ovatus TaxID=28116 RepID=UPI00233E7B4D
KNPCERKKIVTVYDNDTVTIPYISRHYPCRIASLFCGRKLIDEYGCLILQVRRVIKKQNPDEIASAGLYFIFYLNVAT